MLAGGMQNEGAFRGFDERDVRFTVKDGALCIFFLKRPTRPIAIAALGRKRWNGHVARATLLGGGPVAHRHDGEGHGDRLIRYHPGPVPRTVRPE